MESHAWCLLCYSQRFSVNVFGVDAVFTCVCVCVCVWPGIDVESHALCLFCYAQRLKLKRFQCLVLMQSSLLCGWMRIDLLRGIAFVVL